MNGQYDVPEHDRSNAFADPCERLLAAVPVTERALPLAAVATVVPVSRAAA